MQQLLHMLLQDLLLKEQDLYTYQTQTQHLLYTFPTVYSMNIMLNCLVTRTVRGI